MTRGLSTAALAAVQGEVVTRSVAVELLYSSAPVRFAGTPFDIAIGGATFFGVGALGGVSAVEESAELRAYGMTVGLSGCPRDMVAVALTESYQGRRATVWEVLFDANGLPVADPLVIFRGRMDQMDIALGETATINVRLENRLADWERPRIRRYTAEDQRAAWPADKFFDFVPATTEKELIWPNRTFFERR